MTKYTIQRTIQYAYPIGRDFGFKKTFQSDGLEWTEPYSSFIGGTLCTDSPSEALCWIGEVWEKMKHGYEVSGWTAVQEDPDSADIMFVSPEGVRNILTSWTLKYQK